MNNLFKFGLIGVAAWWLLKDQFAFGSDSIQIPNGTSPAPPQGNGATAPAAQTPEAPKTQADVDKIEYAAAFQAVQDYTKNGYTSEQLGAIEQWFYSTAETYKSGRGNLNGFNGYIVTELPKYTAVVKSASPSPDNLGTAALDPARTGLTGNYKLSGHQWNWYRAQRAIAVGIFNAKVHQPNIPGLDAQMTAAEYHALLASTTGLGQLVWR